MNESEQKDPADIDVNHLYAGRDVTIYMNAIGPKTYSAFTGEPQGKWESGETADVTLDKLKEYLNSHEFPPKPQPIKVTGTLFPCALLSAGWWDKHSKSTGSNVEWRDGIQQWLFTGFDLWGPSWDFTWDLDHWETSQKRPCFIAQLGDGDEADSIPVLIPREKAQKLRDYIDAKGRWGGIDAKITGILGHRRDFQGSVDQRAVELLGGLLDYCLWLDEGNPEHGIEPLSGRTSVYSGYLWRCVAPQEFIAGRRPSLRDVYFIWEHVNFANRDAVNYGLESLMHKEEYLQKTYGKLVLVQKSSSLVPGDPTWSPHEVYSMLLGKTGEKI